VAFPVILFPKMTDCCWFREVSPSGAAPFAALNAAE
jgi:hypothetical protein